MNDRTLVVIDMQHTFSASYLVLDECIKIVSAFECVNQPIIFVEYVGCSKTHAKLRRAGSSAHYVSKTKMDGSSDIIAHVMKHSLPNRYVVCGVNTGACVVETIKGLYDKHEQMYVYAPACADPCTLYTVDHVLSELALRQKMIVTKISDIAEF